MTLGLLGSTTIEVTLVKVKFGWVVSLVGFFGSGLKEFKVMTGKLTWVQHSQTACRIPTNASRAAGTARAQSGARDLSTPQQDRAEALFKRKERKAAQLVDGQKAWSEYEEQCRAVRDKTARLRTLRLAREEQGSREEQGYREERE